MSTKMQQVRTEGSVHARGLMTDGKQMCKVGTKQWGTLQNWEQL